MSAPHALMPLRAYFGHHKCASSWIDIVLMGVCGYLGARFKIVHLPRAFESYGSLARYVEKSGIDFLAYTNADPRYLEGLDVYRGFHVIRDPRDIVVSGYFSHRDTHKLFPEIVRHRDRLQALSKEDGLFEEIDFCAGTFSELAMWDYDQAHILELRMEDLTRDPFGGFRRIFRHLDLVADEEPAGARRFAHQALYQVNRVAAHKRTLLPGVRVQSPVRFPRDTVPVSVIDTVVERKSFKHLAGGRKQGQEDPRSHWRKGVPGDWRNHFTAEHVAFFKERYPGLVSGLGYEDNEQWTV